MFLASLYECRKLVIWKNVKFLKFYFRNEESRGEELIENGIRIYFSIFASAVFLNCFSKKGCCLFGMQFSAFSLKKKKNFMVRRVDQGVQLKVSNTQPASRLQDHFSWKLTMLLPLCLRLHALDLHCWIPPGFLWVPEV